MQGSQLAKDLLKTSRELVLVTKGKPRQSNLRRAVSTAYYALFHCMSCNCANSVIGKGKGHGKAAWRQSYRALQHTFAKNACDANSGKQRPILQKFPAEIQDFANQFYSMQIKRHNADYDPYERFTKSAVLADIAIAESVITEFEKVADVHRRAFAALVLFQQPKG
ncbi:hypothetical protein ACRYWZ_15700 [Agrobacterium deltaense]|uniref:hypothetical protein n=1 Tax=Agrobacterium deltaense TaxID=1183412 RepID=UPI003D9897AC